MSQDGGEATDVTDQVVELAMGSTNIEFTAIVSTPNPFEGTKPVWTFNEQDGLPFAIDQSGYSLTFNSILQSKEQHGNYSVSLGNLSTSFRLHVKGTVHACMQCLTVALKLSLLLVSSFVMQL